MTMDLDTILDIVSDWSDDQLLDLIDELSNMLTVDGARSAMLIINDSHDLRGVFVD